MESFLAALMDPVTEPIIPCPVPYVVRPILGLYLVFSLFYSSIRPHLIMGGNRKCLDFRYGKNKSGRYFRYNN